MIVFSTSCQFSGSSRVMLYHALMTSSTKLALFMLASFATATLFIAIENFFLLACLGVAWPTGTLDFFLTYERAFCRYDKERIVKRIFLPLMKLFFLHNLQLVSSMYSSLKHFHLTRSSRGVVIFSNLFKVKKSHQP